MRRFVRLLLVFSGFAAMWTPCAHAENAKEIERIAEQAYIWGMPLVEAGLIRERFTQVSPGQLGEPPAINRFRHIRRLSGPEMKAGVGPNNDTVYSLAWVDLSAGPLVVMLPDFGSRYYTLSINHADSSGEFSFGQRTHGGQLPPLFLRGPNHPGQAPPGMVDVPVRTRYVNLAGRILVRSPEEYAAVHALQDRFGVHLWSDWREGKRGPAPAGVQRLMVSGPANASEASVFFHRLGSLLGHWFIHEDEREIVASLAAIGIDPDKGFRPERLSPEDLAAIERGFAAGKQRVLAASLALGVQQNGWTTNYRGPRFGTDWLLRAGVAKDQIYVTIPEEAVYPTARVDASGTMLSGAHRYRIRFAPDALPPVEAFWSVTAYDDAGHMIPNRAERYSVGDRTAGLTRDADGGVTIILAAERPDDLPPANWLPVAANAPFYLMMRLYRPKPEVLEGQWVPPVIERLGDE
jgi:hypothetical protein